MSTAYHLTELRIALDPRASGHHLPSIPRNVRAVLDVGCGAGQTLIACGLDPQIRACGIDPDEEAIALGRSLTDRVEFHEGKAEDLPFPDATFDYVLSRVALPYTNIPRAISEIARVLQPGGIAWLMLHPLEFSLRQVLTSVRLLAPRAFVFNCYTVLNGTFFHLTGRQVSSLRRYESWQSTRRMVDCLRTTGFGEITVELRPHFVMTARKLAQGRP